jgi:thioredoxin-related protein
MKLIKAIMILCIPLNSLAQTIGSSEETGIQFKLLSSWEQVIAEAKSQGKYIFVDCYASWCVPCKEMDNRVYADKNVGNFFNDKFISIKLQIDSSETDGDLVKQWYSTAATFNEKFKIKGYPTFLFFSADGVLEYQAIGYKDPTTFLSIASFSVSTETKQYNKNIENYKKGVKDYRVLPGLLKITKEVIGSDSLAYIIAKDYKENFLDRLPIEELLSRERLDFIRDYYFFVTTKDKFFHLFYNYADSVDKILNQKGLSDRLVKYYIVNEEIENKLWKNGQPLTLNPKWKKLEHSIKEKYSSTYAQTLVPTYKLSFYKRIKNWGKMAELRDEAIARNCPKAGLDLFDPNGTWRLNQDAWAVFLYCADTSIIKKALSWINLAIHLESPEPNMHYLDTKANLLYKLGKKDEALKLENEAIKVAIEQNEKDPVKTFMIVIDKMKRNEATWKEN